MGREQQGRQGRDVFVYPAVAPDQDAEVICAYSSFFLTLSASEPGLTSSIFINSTPSTGA